MEFIAFTGLTCVTLVVIIYLIKQAINAPPSFFDDSIDDL